MRESLRTHEDPLGGEKKFCLFRLSPLSSWLPVLPSTPHHFSHMLIQPWMAAGTCVTEAKTWCCYIKYLQGHHRAHQGGNHSHWKKHRKKVTWWRPWNRPVGEPRVEILSSCFCPPVSQVFSTFLCLVLTLQVPLTFSWQFPNGQINLWRVS